jgi:hypothetical protein
MKKIILSAIVLVSITSNAHVKVGSNVLNLATNANFQIEGTAPTNQFLIYKYGKIAVGATSIPGQKDYYFTQNKIGGIDLRVRNTSTTGSSFAQICAEIENNRFYMYQFNSTYPTTNLMYQPGQGTLDNDNAINFVSGLNGMKFFTSNTGVINAIERLNIAPNGNITITTTPTITSASKVLVKEPVINIISEQVMNGKSISTTAVA